MRLGSPGRHPTADRAANEGAYNSRCHWHGCITCRWIKELHKHRIYGPANASCNWAVEDSIEKLPDLKLKVPRWIRIPQRIVAGIGIPIEFLRISRIGHDRIGADEPAKNGIVGAGLVVIKARAGVEFLARVLVGHIDGRRAWTGIGAHGAIRVVCEGFHLGARAVGDDAARTQMIAMPVVYGAIGGDRRNPSAPRPDEPRAIRVITFIELAEVARGRGAHDLLDPPAIARSHRSFTRKSAPNSAATALSESASV